MESGGEALPSGGSAAPGQGAGAGETDRKEKDTIKVGPQARTSLGAFGCA